MMRSTLLAALVGAAVPMPAFAQTADELKNDEKTPGDILTYGMGYSHQRFSPLTHINRDNVKRLVPAWSYSMADNNGQQSHPLIKDGVMYITDHAKTVAARCADRQADLEVDDRISARDNAHRVLRHRQPRRRYARRQALPHYARCQRHRTRHQDRQGALAHESCGDPRTAIR